MAYLQAENSKAFKVTPGRGDFEHLTNLVTETRHYGENGIFYVNVLIRPVHS